MREVENWLLADHQGLSKFTGIPVNKLTPASESIIDPKQHLLSLVHRHASSDMKARLVTRHSGGLRPGTAYNATLSEFAAHIWQPVRAEKHSDSLKRARQRLSELASRVLDKL